MQCTTTTGASSPGTSNAPIAAGFHYTPADLRESWRQLSWRSLGFKRSRRWVGWMSGMAMGLMTCVVIFAQPAGPSGAFDASAPALPLIPWVTLFLFAVLVAMRLLRHRRADSNPMLHRAWSLSADQTGLTLSDPLEKLERSWSLFTEISQTKNVFLLHMAKAYAVMIPKRAFGNPTEAGAFWALAQDRIRPGVGHDQ